MKIGIRKPSIKKSIKARTTGKIKRSIKKATVPAYGKKGTGLIKDPKKAVYNKVYNKTTVSVVPKIDFGSKYSTKSKQNISNNASYTHNNSRDLKVYLLIFSAQIVAFFWIPLMTVSMPAMLIMLFYIGTSKNITVLDTYTGIKQVMSRTEYKKLKK